MHAPGCERVDFHMNGTCMKYHRHNEQTTQLSKLDEDRLGYNKRNTLNVAPATLTK